MSNFLCSGNKLWGSPLTLGWWEYLSKQKGKRMAKMFFQGEINFFFINGQGGVENGYSLDIYEIIATKINNMFSIANHKLLAKF